MDSTKFISYIDGSSIHGNFNVLAPVHTWATSGFHLLQFFSNCCRKACPFPELGSCKIFDCDGNCSQKSESSFHLVITIAKQTYDFGDGTPVQLRDARQRGTDGSSSERECSDVNFHAKRLPPSKCLRRKIKRQF